jgi:uncharacterized protein involved in exopolysaccharide biosynthesis
MQSGQILPLIKRKLGAIVLTGVLVAALLFLFLVVSQKNFKVGTDLLVVQNQSGAQDFYSLSKSAEYIGKILSEAVYSELFIDEVIKTEKVGSEFLPFDKKDRMDEWKKTVKVNNNPQLGIMEIETLGNDQKETLAISEAISQVLTTKNNLFRGEGQNIDVRILSGPILEKNPSLSDIIFIMVGGFLAGMILGIFWIIYGPKKNNDRFVLYTGKSKSVSGRFNHITDPNEYAESLRYLDRQ